ncbi:MAG TPA: HD domain-containing protein [Symbiobacteriaceae bacterium]|nr:HD domain-containing protein [Symbiobacteriaceae bacterium]
MTAPEPVPFDPLVFAMCEKYRYEEPHCRRVAALARRLFDLLGPLHGLGEEEARLLTHGALLHDIGHFVSYRGHHRHGEYLIATDAALAGYPPKQRALLAYLARSHRKRPVPPPGRPALQLAALVRLADGLDHDRTGQVHIAGTEVTGRKIHVAVSGLDPGGLAELLRRKAILMEPAFGRKVAWAMVHPGERPQ